MIWCVEDDSSIRDIDIYTLTSTGFEARGFEDGELHESAAFAEQFAQYKAQYALPEEN